MEIKALINQFKKFVIIGLLSTVINYGTFYILYKFLHVYYPWASVTGYVSGVIFGYFFNRKWTFSSIIGTKILEFIFYFSVYLGSLLLSVTALKILVENFGLNPLLANFLSIGISTVTNFVGCKYLVFHEGYFSKFRSLGIYLTPAFWIILVVKIISGSMFGSHFLTKGFIPFVNSFSQNFTNPYQTFAHLSPALFSYPAGMLDIFSFSFIILSRILPENFYQLTNVQLFTSRLPILFFDIVLYLVLCKLLPTKKKQILWLYFASPVLFYINYFHGQLDVIPTALLFVSLYALLKNKNSFSFLMLGLGIATKTHLLAALPFYYLYLYRNRFGYKKIITLFASAAAVFLFINFPAVSPEFFQAVFNNPEQRRLFTVAVPFNFNNLLFFAAPASIFFVFYKFANYKRWNFDSLLLSLGLTYIILITLVPPMQGWYYWSLPFLIFFFVKFKDSKNLSIWALNLLFLGYFIFSKDSDIYESLSATFKWFSNIPNPYDYLISLGKDANTAQNLLFTGLESILIACALWVFSIGTKNIELFQKKKERFVFGVAGDSGVGKSTLSENFVKLFGQNNSVVLNGDDTHRWERGHENWQVVSHLNPLANKVHLDLEHATRLMSGESVNRENYDHATGKFSNAIEIRPNKFMLFQGLMPLVLEELRNLHDLKIFLEADELLRQKWKIQRDSLERQTAPEEIKKQIEFRQPDSEKYIQPQKQYADWIIKYFENEPNALGVEYLFKNSIYADQLIDTLKNQPELNIDHTYPDLNFQKLKVTGNISKETITEIAYQLFPNLPDLVENQPEFETGISGINQLFLLNFLDNYHKYKTRHEANF